MDRREFRAVAAARRWRAVDADIVDQAGEGGVEARSSCEFVTVLADNHRGVDESFQAADAVISSEIDEGWCLGPFTVCPPFEPMRNLPRNVVLQAKQKVVDGQVATVVKARVTTNASYGVEGAAAPVLAPNAGLTHDEVTVALPTAIRHGAAAAVVDGYGDGDSIRAQTYSIDGESAFRFLLDQRGDWWMQTFAWPVEGRTGGSDRDGGVWARRRGQFTGRRFGFVIDTRPDFGGGHNPNRYVRVARLKRAQIRHDQALFDAGHPLPACARHTQQRRAQLQREGELPTGAEQLEPSDLQSFIDDDGGSALDDVTGVPMDLRSVPLDLSAMAVNDGTPGRLDTRVANHCRIAIAVNLRMGFAVSPKTQLGDGVVSLGLRLCVLRWYIDCPPDKRLGMLGAVDELESLVAADAAFQRKAVERLTGQLVFLSQVDPGLLPRLHPGYVVGGFKRSVVRMRPGTQLKAGLLRMLARARQALQPAVSIPLLYDAPFGVPGMVGVLFGLTDASRAASDDGVGGWAFNPWDSGELLVFSEAWPPWAKETMARAAARRAEQGDGPSFSMPAAELFGSRLLGRLVERHTGRVAAVEVAVSDCKPAVGVLNKTSSPSALMRAVLEFGSGGAPPCYGVWIPRDLNTDADLLSHPSQLETVLHAAVALGWRVVRLRPSHADWEELRVAVVERSAADRA